MNKRLALKVVALCLICSIITGVAVYAANPTTTLTISGGNYPAAPSYTVFTDGSNYFAKNELGEIEYSGSNPSTVFESAENNGGQIYVANGIYTLTEPIDIDYAGAISIIGETGHNDRFYPAVDDPDSGVVFVADDIDAFRIGSASSNHPIVNIKNIAVVGKDPTTEPLGDSVYSTGIGFNLTGNVKTITFENILVHRMYYGIYFNAGSGNEIIRVNLNYVSMTYNYYGVYHAGYVLRYLHIDHLEGYLNDKHLLKVSPSYDLIIFHLDDEASGFTFTGSTDSPVEVAVSQDAQLSHISIISSKGLSALDIDACLEVSFSDNATCHMDNLILTGGDNRGLKLWGSTVKYFFTVNDFSIGNWKLSAGYSFRGSTSAMTTGIYVGNAGLGVISNGFIDEVATPINNATTLSLRYSHVWDGTAWLDDYG